MRTVVRGWSVPGFLVRLAIVAATGVMWAVDSLHLILADPQYMDPVTFSDFFAVYAYSAAWLLTAAALLVLREVARLPGAEPWVIVVVAAACAITGVANWLEDGLGMKGFGSVYVSSVVITGLGMFVVAALLWTSAARRLTFVPAVGGLAMVTVVIGGGVLALVAWLGFGAVLISERRANPEAVAGSSSEL